MPKNVTVLQVLVASPSDVSAEREVLETVIRELNITWTRTLDLRLELIRWETHIAPDFGIDAQDVINRQLPSDYDLFIGIMWSRFGTPTKRAGSGTEEEFQQAFERYIAGPKSVRLMIYFKDEKLSPSQLDPSQLMGVLAFKKKVEEHGGLHFTFVDTKDFEAMIRMHISFYVQSWKQQIARPPTDRDTEAHVTQIRISPTEEDEAGLLDLIEKGHEHFNKLKDSGERITSATNDLATRIDQRTKEMIAISSMPPEVKFKKGKKISDQTAEDLQQFVAQMQPEISIFSENYEAAIRALGQAASLVPDFIATDDDSETRSQLGSLLDVTRQLQSTFNNTYESLNSFRQTIAGLPRVTTSFNRAKRAAVDVLGAMMKEINTASTLTGEAEKGINALIE